MALELKKKSSKKAPSDKPAKTPKAPKGSKGPKKEKPAKEAKGFALPSLSKKDKAPDDKPFTPTLPLVNLLSPEVQEVVEQRRLKRLFLGLGVGVVVAVIAVYLGQQGMIAVAQGKLEDEQSKSAALTAQQQALAPIKAFYAQIETNKGTIQTTMANEVLTSQVVSELNRTTPAGVSFQNVAVSLASSGGGATTATPTDPTATTGACPSQDPYNTGGVSAGCINVDGVASSREALGIWLDNLDRTKTFTVAFIPSTSAADGAGVTFSATVGLSETVYKKRYADPDFLKGGTK